MDAYQNLSGNNYRDNEIVLNSVVYTCVTCVCVSVCAYTCVCACRLQRACHNELNVLATIIAIVMAQKIVRANVKINSHVKGSFLLHLRFI